MTGVASLAMALDPAMLMEAVGLDPDPWQAEVLRSAAPRQLLLCARQMGKSTCTGCLGLHAALFEPDALILLVSPSQRQSGELLRKVQWAYDRLGRPLGTVEDSATTLALPNGSRVVSLPGNPATVRGFSGPRLVIVDEASQVPDAMLAALAPMLAVSSGRFVALSTPFGKRGWFCEAWHDPATAWHRTMMRAGDNPRIRPEFLAEQRTLLGPRWYAQEYECEFVDAIDQVFATEVVEAAFTSEAEPLFGDD